MAKRTTKADLRHAVWNQMNEYFDTLSRLKE